MSEAGPLHGLTVLALESRRAQEMAELIRRHGGTPFVAPSLREVPLRENPDAIEFFRRLEAGRLDLVILLTGVGTRALAAALEDICPREHLAELLRRTTVVARGPKPVAALRELGVTPDVLVPEPNTWREILETVDRWATVAGRRVAVQEYGRPNPELIAGLVARGANVFRVPVYRWDLPEDPGPLHEAARRLASGGIDIALFTSAQQVDHLMHVVDALGLRDQLVAASRRVVVASIGPICSKALQSHGLPVDLEPEHPKMGHLVAAAARQARELLAVKRNA